MHVGYNKTSRSSLSPGARRAEKTCPRYRQTPNFSGLGDFLGELRQPVTACAQALGREEDLSGRRGLSVAADIITPRERASSCLNCIFISL